jgi:nitroreductase
MGDVDAGIVTTQMMLEAAELGLGSTWVGYFDPACLRTAFDIPEHLIPVALLPIGYPREDCTPSPFHENRLDTEHTVFFNSFRGVDAPREP